jgi:preprotein translocase subunit YajC
MKLYHSAALVAVAVLTLASWPLTALAIPHATAPVTDETRDTLLPTGTLFRIAMKQTVSSARSKTGDGFAFTIVDDVKIGDRVAVPSGTSGTGKVVKSAPAHGGRVNGILKLQFDPIALSGGTSVIIDITQESLVADQNEHNGMAGSVAAVADMTVPGFFLIDFLRKGDDIVLTSGAAFHVAVTQDAFLPPADR